MGSVLTKIHWYPGIAFRRRKSAKRNAPPDMIHAGAARMENVLHALVKECVPAAVTSPIRKRQFAKADALALKQPGSVSMDAKVGIHASRWQSVLRAKQERILVMWKRQSKVARDS